MTIARDAPSSGEGPGEGARTATDDGPKVGRASIRRDPPRLTPEREQALLAAHRAGAPDALGELLRGYQRRIHAVCWRMVGDDDLAADLTQDAIVRVIQNIDRYDGRAALSTWIIRIAMNGCLSHLRKARLRRHESLQNIAPGSAAGGPIRERSTEEPGVAGRVEQDELEGLLGRALADLDPEVRAILILRDLQELEYAQISDVLDVPVGTVKSRIFRARVALRDRLEQLQGGADSDEDARGETPANAGKARPT